ncbi:AraC family transcriptional regulator [Pseudohalioglobus lutimaris]|uniref:AraC family transcriptional regulator n=1 Tax=Pseudohalioglobus lutimaris TaxID=1737061 RepID=A0A2N5X2L1_9GAMM|nr:AraC family transcriptional regulator [Pseudohalioglobus lutimaris]PLW68719.1 AraC family transcriptional regulator [Pseudohalioglobus lutimaris]
MVQSSSRIFAITLRKAHSYMKGLGVEPEVLLANTGLSAADLADPYKLISEEQARNYYLNLINATNCESVGLEIGWRTSLSDLGPHGMAMLTERTGGEALRKTWELRDNYNLLINWRYSITDNLVLHTIQSAEEDPRLRLFLVERALATIQANTEEMFGEAMQPLRLTLDYPRPEHVASYREKFNCPIQFSQELTQLYYPQEWEHRLLETYDPEAVEILGTLRASLHNKLSSEVDVVEEVRLALRRKSGEFPSLERIAEGLAMSSRTLHRKLGQRDVRYQDLLDDERRRIAEDLLLNTGMNIQQIAVQCGFSDAQNFSQAFRRWRGKSPSEFRSSQD